MKISFYLQCLTGFLLWTGLAVNAHGQTATWANTGTGSWSTPANWTWSGTAPTPAIPNLSTAVALTNRGTAVLQDETFTITSISMTNAALELTKSTTGGVLNVPGTFYIATTVNNIASVLVDGVGSIINKTTTGTQIQIGVYGTATMMVSNGGRVNVASTTHVGVGSSNGSTGVGTLTVKTGGQYVSTSTYILGYRGNGTMNVIEAGYAKTANGFLGGYGQDANRVGGTGTVNVNGVGSLWDTGILYVGHSGTGTLNIENSGVVANTSTSFIGFYNGGRSSASPPEVPTADPIFGTGTVNVRTGGTWQSNGVVSIGTAGGTGTLNVSSQGRVNAGGGNGSIVLGAKGTVNVGANPLLENAVPDAPGILMTGSVTSAEAAPRPLNLFHSDQTGSYYLTTTGAVGGNHVGITGSIQLNAMTGTTTIKGANTLTGGVNIGGHPEISAKLVMTHTQGLGAGFVTVKENGTLEVASTLNYASLGYLELQGGSALSFDAHPVGGTSVPKFNITNWLDLQLEEGEKIKIYLHGTDAISNPELYDWAFLRTGVGIFDDVTDMFEVISDVPGFYVYERSGNLVLGMAVIPEPGRAVLLLAGLLGLGLRRRR